MTEPVPVKGRFAPSPSGRMHLGNLFCALAAWLSARSQGGSIVLRIEDLDHARSKTEWAALLQDDLQWFGLDWDEGGLELPAYRQSTRSAFYAETAGKLRKKGLIYPCFCTRAELHAAEAPHLSDGQVLYSGKCRRLPPEEAARRAANEPHALRLAVPDRTVTFTDRLQGAYTQNLAAECGDFLIRRSDGVWAYQLAVVADDADMGVNEVVRGCDLLSSTPRQIYLYTLLGLPAPSYMHIPLLTAPDGRRLSKRDGDCDVGVLRQHFKPKELCGRLAFLCGLLPSYMPVKPRELIPLFAPEKLKKQNLVIGKNFFER